MMSAEETDLHDSKGRKPEGKLGADESDDDRDPDVGETDSETRKPVEKLDVIELFSPLANPDESESELKEDAMKELDAREDRSLKMVAEAALFMCGRGMRADELGKSTGMSTRNARKALDALVSDFASWKKIHALEVVHNADDDRYLMRVRDYYLPRVKDLTTLKDIPDGEMRTLSVIAPNEPVLQSYVVKVRGNKAYYQIRRLMGKGLIKTEPKGRSVMIMTTRKFAEYFGKPAREIKRSLESPGSLADGKLKDKTKQEA